HLSSHLSTVRFVYNHPMLGGQVRGRHVGLRTTVAGDLADHVRWHEDLAETTWMPVRPRVQSTAQREVWLEAVAADPARWHWEIQAGEVHVGYVGISL